MAKFTTPKGTQDIYGAKALGFDHIEQTFAALAQIYGFVPMRTPTFEATELFERGVGETSDIVTKEMYTFVDKGNRSMTLRPEGTAGVMRAIVSEKLYATEDLPLKYYYSGKCFRYERPQLGRYREFHQFGVESVGVSSIFNDVEAILLGITALNVLGLQNVSLKINTLGDEASRLEYTKALKEYFKPHIHEMCSDCQNRYEKNPLRILDCKVPSDQEIIKEAPSLSEFLSPSAKSEFDQLLNILEGYGVSYEIDDKLVRGLDYYSHTVFEFHYVSSKGKDYGAIGAGGHYEHLLEEVGGPSLPGVGFAVGIERLYSVLNDDEILENIAPSLDFYVMSVGENSFDDAFSLLTALRGYGYQGDINFAKHSFKQLFKRAERANARYAIIIGDDEVANQVVNIKDLTSQEQVSVAYGDVIDYIDGLYNSEEHDHHDHK